MNGYQIITPQKSNFLTCLISNNHILYIDLLREFRSSCIFILCYFYTWPITSPMSYYHTIFDINRTCIL